MGQGNFAKLNQAPALSYPSSFINFVCLVDHCTLLLSLEVEVRNENKLG
jgi:hypothetical protein